MFYRLISLLLLPFWCLHAWRHGVKHRQPDYLGLRLTRDFPAVPGDCLWLHAASVGEVETLTPIARHYLNSGHQLLFTSFTATGLATIRRHFADQVVSSVIPIDFAPLCRRFLTHFRIRRGIILETELWPELLQQAAQQQIPLVLINARLSSRSTANGLTRRLLKPVVGRFDAILCRYESDAKRFLELGAMAEKIEIIGNLKTASNPIDSLPRLIEPPYLLLASSHDPEEVEFLRSRPPESSLPLLVIVPRHPDRSKSLQAMMDKLAIRYTVRSKQQMPLENSEVYLADTLGELQSFMQHATLVVMGGSFEGTGGHNLHEPARLGCAIITGPSDSNIRNDIELLGPDEGILQVESMSAAWLQIERLISNPRLAEKLAVHAQQRSASQDNVLINYTNSIDRALELTNDQA